MIHNKLLDDSVGKTGRKKPPAAGKGRPKGAINKNTKAIKEMILAALESVGGEQYLAEQAIASPSAFLSLVGKVLPTEVKNAEGGGFIINVVTGVPRD